MNWEKLLSKRTQVEREKEPEAWSQYPVSDFEKDYKCIILSAAFRRLQDKTQVFPLDNSDFVRTRLTHSIEVSIIAKQLGIMITHGKTPYAKKVVSDTKEYASEIPSVLECAGLLHDLGNPPFGHFGEEIIRDWFKKEFKKEKFSYKGTPIINLFSGDNYHQMYNDLCNFEGNAQALRILSKIRHRPEGYDINLTYSTINTLIKYPTDSESIKKTEDETDDSKLHKMGYFYAEKDLFNKVCTETGTKLGNDEYARHPLTYLMEAADDIAYATSDLEDALKKGLFTVNQFIDYFYDRLEKYDNEKTIEPKKKEKSIELIENLEDRLEKLGDKRDKESELIAFQKWTVYAKQWLMYVVAFSFSKNYDEVMSGEYKKDLFDEGFHTYSIKILKNAMGEFVFDSSEILRLELSAKKIISSLLDDFIYAVIHWDTNDDNYKLTKADKKFINIISDNYKKDYDKSKGDDEIENLYLRFLMVTDYISGMTDSFAKSLYQELNGIN